jgi:hypothetical protein
MITNALIKRSLADLGYRANEIFEGYKFAAVDVVDAPVREAALAAFFDSPASYRNAAIGVVRTVHDSDWEEAVSSQRSLGAPILLALSNTSVSAWVFGSAGAEKIDQAPLERWAEFQARHASVWNSASMKRLKIVEVRSVTAKQQVLFDPAVLYTIQTQVQIALDRLLRQFLKYFDSPLRSQLSIQRDYLILFPLAFRLLAAKILYDRDDQRIQHIDRGDVESVINTVSSLYSLSPVAIRWGGAVRKQLEESWQSLASGLHVRNIAADDLAFVYENTLITPETRQAYGTHSTPPAVAEYVLRSFALPEGPALQNLRVYEPFAGSCVFLTAALRRFKELLPGNWSPEAMHRHLVSHFAASEIDQFACEIARLALVLADYPNANGWHIRNEDVFDRNTLRARAAQADIVVCNPPFEDFETRSSDGSIHKPVAALTAILERQPAFLGIVMPPGFEAHSKYRSVANDVVRKYRDVELLELPEGSFRHASVGATVLIAQKPQPSPTERTILRKSTVHRLDRSAFERSLRPSRMETVRADPSRSPAFLALQPLRDVWEYLVDYPTLGSRARIHRGLEWKKRQQAARSTRQEKGFRRGLHNINGSLSQFRIIKSEYLDCRESAARGRALTLPWHQAKVICNAIRTSRGPWRLAAAADHSGLVCSQQFFGIWPRSGDVSLEAIAAVLNSPLANAFSFAHDPHKGLRIEVMERIPLPQRRMPSEIFALIEHYMAVMASDGPLFSPVQRSSTELLLEIDALVLSAYDLPPRLEKSLLKLMSASGRPCGYEFPSYPGSETVGAIQLWQRLQERASPARDDLWKSILAPLPTDVSDVFDVT